MASPFLLFRIVKRCFNNIIPLLFCLSMLFLPQFVISYRETIVLRYLFIYFSNAHHASLAHIALPLFKKEPSLSAQLLRYFATLVLSVFPHLLDQILLKQLLLFRILLCLFWIIIKTKVPRHCFCCHMNLFFHALI